MRKAYEILDALETNKIRTADGNLPANFLLLRGAGMYPTMPTFEEKWSDKLDLRLRELNNQTSLGDGKRTIEELNPFMGDGSPRDNDRILAGRRLLVSSTGDGRRAVARQLGTHQQPDGLHHRTAEVHAAFTACGISVLSHEGRIRQEGL